MIIKNIFSCCTLLFLVSVINLFANDYELVPHRKLACENADRWIDKLEQKRNKIIASSTLPSKNNSYSIDNVIDGDNNTCWVPERGPKGNGIYEFLIFKIPYKSQGIRIINGYAKNDKLFKANNRVKQLYLGFIVKRDPQEYDVCKNEHNYSISYQTVSDKIYTLKDTYKLQNVFFKEAIHGFDWDDKEIFKYNKGIYLVLSIWDIYKGSKYNDTCISEIEIIK